MKKSFAIFVAAILMTGWQYSGAAVVAAADEAGSSVSIAQQDPIDTFIDTLDSNWYGGIYVEKDIYHILALQQYYPQLVKLVQAYDPTGSVIVVDDPGDQLIYTRPQLLAATDRLWANAKELGVVGTGIFIDGDGTPRNGVTVTVSHSVPLTDELKQKIEDCAQITSLRFESGPDSNPNTAATAEENPPAAAPSPDADQNPNTGAV